MGASLQLPQEEVAVHRPEALAGKMESGLAMSVRIVTHDGRDRRSNVTRFTTHEVCGPRDCIPAATI